MGPGPMGPGPMGHGHIMGPRAHGWGWGCGGIHLGVWPASYLGERVGGFIWGGMNKINGPRTYVPGITRSDLSWMSVSSELAL